MLFHRLLAVAVTIIAAAGYSSGCLDKGGDASDAAVYRDSRIDAAPRPDAASAVCDIDDLVVQLGCDTGEQCTLVSEDELGCYTAGSIPAYSSCDSTELPEDGCSVGTICTDRNDPGAPRCLPFCLEQYENCPDGGRCLLSSGYDGVMLCDTQRECEPVGDVGTPVCENGAGCYYSTGYETYCIEDGGTKQLGEDCSNLECDTGLVCQPLQVDGAYVFECQKLCTYLDPVACEDATDCTLPDDCDDASCIPFYGTMGTCDY